jgi:hypothetical protein
MAELTTIRVRVRRTLLEESSVSVPITDAVVRTAEDGSLRVDGAMVLAAALELAKLPGQEWSQESAPEIEIHPIQAG